MAKGELMRCLRTGTPLGNELFPVPVERMLGTRVEPKKPGAKGPQKNTYVWRGRNWHGGKQ